MSLAGCSKSSPASPTPTPPASCSYSVGGAPVDAVNAAGTELTLSITTGASCSWTAASSSAFITIVGASSGTGPGSVKFAMAANTGSARQGSLTVAGQAIQVTQQAGPVPGCSYSVNSTSATAPQAGGDVSFDVTTAAGCAWTTTVADAFVTIKQGASGTGNGTVVLTVAANSGAGRNGTATIAGNAVTIAQAGTAGPPPPPCAFSVSPMQISAPSIGETYQINVTVTQGLVCTFTSSYPDSFIRPTGGNVNPGFGGFVTIQVAANHGNARTGILIVAGITITVTQPAPTHAIVLSYQGDSGEYLSQGQSQSFTLTGPQGIVEIDENTPGLTASMPLTNGHTWSLRMTDSSLSAPAAGLHSPTVKPFTFVNGYAGLDFSVDGRTCNIATGRVLVAEATYGVNKSVTRFHAKFELFCENTSRAVRGEVWIDAAGSTAVPPMSSFPAPGAPTTFLQFQSAPGDPIGQGQSATYTVANVAFSPSEGSANGPAVLVSARNLQGGPTVAYDLLLVGPSGPHLTPGTYDNAVFFGSHPPGTPGMGFIRPTAGCSTVSGKFVVLEASYGPNGEVWRFHATFEQSCNGFTPKLTGEIYIVADPWR